MFRICNASCLSISGKFFVLLQSHIGGKIIVLQSTLPNIGQGLLKPREDPKLLGTASENNLLKPSDVFYKTFAVDCSRTQVTVDLFLFGVQYLDIATLGSYILILVGSPRFTGGSIYYYSAFNATRSEDATKFSTELAHFLSRPLGLEAGKYRFNNSSASSYIEGDSV